MSEEELLTGENLHDRATELAWNSQEISAKKFSNETFPIVNYAILNIFHDAMIIHQSIRGLVYNGWSSSAAILVRTLLDLTVSLIAIVNSKNSTLAAFRYFNSNHRQIMRDNRFSLELRKEIRQLIKEQISQLEPGDKLSAYQFLKEKDRPYWFWEEWSSPKKVIDAFASPEILEEYQRLSSAAHGGFYGLRLFRDRYSEYGVTPRLPLGMQAVLVSVLSSRKIVELVSIRSAYEDLSLEPFCIKLRDSIEAIEILKEDLS